MDGNLETETIEETGVLDRIQARMVKRFASIAADGFAVCRSGVEYQNDEGCDARRKYFGLTRAFREEQR